jgi:hypothetical protein
MIFKYYLLLLVTVGPIGGIILLILALLAK